jgi:hypothetical protein
LSPIVGLKSSSVNVDAFSKNPYEFFARPNTFTSVSISVMLNAFLKETFLLLEG